MRMLALFLTLFICTFAVSYKLRTPHEIGSRISINVCDENLLKGEVENYTPDVPTLVVQSVIVPCKSETTKEFIKEDKKYSPEVLDEVKRMSGFIISESQRELTEKEKKLDKKRGESLLDSSGAQMKHFPRFNLNGQTPQDYFYYGVHAGNYKDVKQFLGDRVCAPQFDQVTSTSAYLGLFFSINQLRDYGGMVKIINERIVTLIEGSMDFSGDEKYFERRLIPTALFSTWVHKDLDRDYKGFLYQFQSIAQESSAWSQSFFLSPWLYNTCNKSMATVHNNCSLDPSYDMEFKEFFYLAESDLMVGNIYCKKSSDPAWSRIATFEFLRI